MNVSAAAPSSTGNEDLVGRRVLLVDDDPTVAEVASSYLRAGGFVVEEAGDGFAALQAAERFAPDLIVLDRMLPGIDGLEVFRRLRERMSTPVILLTALGSEDERIAGLEAGADDYLAKPFSPRELVLRVQSVLRRSIGEFTPESVLEYGEFRLDPSARIAARAGVELSLTVREFDLFEFLLKHPNQVFSREDLLRTVWGWTYGDLSTVTVHVRRLREKIERDPRSPTMLTTVWGVGYRFTMDGVPNAVV
ncbi:response regulator transcription factor [Agromyces sp. SYSU K20354]|uniref:response regulator transcription factor n=1 Tax=Agromyces cavernae TaxID=2898659 RepID=UPI001E302AA5|nr:response regulator transcription factor [Agromyces cavernae]MCD2442044.1 response regulator transcription factor [Agromyces cavernae]